MAKGDSAGFEKAVQEWIKQADAESLDIFKDATRAMLEEVRQAVPRDTGNLSNSVVLSPDRNITKGRDDEVFPDPRPNDEAVLSNVELGDKIALGVRAAYAARREFGYISTSSDGTHKNIPGTHAVTATLSKWKGLVRRAAQKRNRAVR